MSNAFTGVKVFSATMVAVRDQLGEQVTSWLNARQGEIDVSEIMVRQSSDNAFHCVAIIVFYKHRENAKKSKPGELITKPTFVKSEQPSRASEAPAPRRLNFKRTD